MKLDKNIFARCIKKKEKGKMLKKLNSKLLRRTTSLVLVTTLFVVGVIGDHYIDGKNAKEERKAKIAMKEAESLDFDYSMLDMNELKSPDEMELAVSDTEMGKISDELQEAYRSLKMACENNVKGYKEAGEVFNDKVVSLKNRATKILSDNNNVNENESDYKKDIVDNFKLLEEYSSKLCRDNCYNVNETVTKIGELVDPEVEEISLSNDLSFSNIASDDIESETVSEDETEDDSYDYEEEAVLPEDLRVKY